MVDFKAMSPMADKTAMPPTICTTATPLMVDMTIRRMVVAITTSHLCHDTVVDGRLHRNLLGQFASAHRSLLPQAIDMKIRDTVVVVIAIKRSRVAASHSSTTPPPAAALPMTTMQLVMAILSLVRKRLPTSYSRTTKEVRLRTIPETAMALHLICESLLLLAKMEVLVPLRQLLRLLEWMRFGKRLTNMLESCDLLLCWRLLCLSLLQILAIQSLGMMQVLPDISCCSCLVVCKERHFEIQ
jgi:hypothetical protein